MSEKQEAPPAIAPASDNGVTTNGVNGHDTALNEKSGIEGKLHEISAAHLGSAEKHGFKDGTLKVTDAAAEAIDGVLIPEGAIVVDGNKGEHLPDEQLRSRLTFSTFIWGVPADQRYIELPSEEEKQTLRRVPDHLILSNFIVGLLELFERFSYYGCQAVFTNYIQYPRPDGSRTGAGHGGQSGALGQGQRASFGLTTFNSFWVFVTPLFGGYVADTYLGRFNTLAIAILFAFAGHLFYVGSATPSSIDNPDGALALLAVGMVISGIGTGAWKANIAPMIAEQNHCSVQHIRVMKSGERVIVDPVLTVQRTMMYFYFLINCGALAGQLGMVYCERDVGFWLAYLLPTILLAVSPFVLYGAKKIYVLRPPAGSVLPNALRLLRMALAPCWSWNPFNFWRRLKSDDFWRRVHPSNIAPENRPAWMTFDDTWVDEVRRGFKACTVFCLVPLWWLCYNQINSNLTSQAAQLSTHGVPNDVLQNLDPFALLILIPILDLFVYPGFHKIGFRWTPLRRMTAGFFIASAAMIWAVVLQYYIYQTSPCGTNASDCEAGPSPINVWAQTGAWVLVALSEISLNITGYEYAFTKAPKNMRGLVQAVYLFTNAIASAIGEAFTPISVDPLLEWNYGTIAVLSFVGGILFAIFYLSQDKDEEHENEIHEGAYLSKGAAQAAHIEEGDIIAHRHLPSFAEGVSTIPEGHLREKEGRVQHPQETETQAATHTIE